MTASAEPLWDEQRRLNFGAIAAVVGAFIAMDIADWLPMTHIIRVTQEPWLGLGDGADLVITAGILAGSTVVWLWRAVRISRVS